MNLKIYISQSTLTELEKTKEKYKVCISAIVDILLNKIYLPAITGIDLKYIDKNKKNQTTIVINKENQNYLSKLNPSSKTILLSNLAYIYYHMDLLKEYGFTEENINKYKRDIGNELSKKRDNYWDYNRQYRNLYRARKQYDREKEKKVNM